MMAAPSLGHAQEVNEEAPRTTVVDRGDHLEVRSGKLVVLIANPVEGTPERALFDDLSPEDKTRFLEKRMSGIAFVARALNSMKYGFGFGSIVMSGTAKGINALKFWNWRKSDDRDLRKEYSASTTSEAVAEAEFNRQNELVKMTMRERSESIVGSILRGFDKSIWAQAPIYSHANEHAFYGGLGIGGLGKTGSKFKLGGLLELGFSIGFNHETKAVVFQFIRDVEKFRDSMMPGLVFGGVYVKLGYYMANQQPGHLRHRGSSFYPPMLPGFTTQTADVVIVGMNAGVPLMTFPPSPFDNGLTYLNGAKPDAVLRVTISPKTLGFIRIETLPLKALFSPVTNVVRAMKNRVVGRGAACPRLFSPAGA
jgi:hypothetical protein